MDVQHTAESSTKRCGDADRSDRAENRENRQHGIVVVLGAPSSGQMRSVRSRAMIDAPARVAFRE